MTYNTLSKEDYNTILELSKKPELNLYKLDHNNNYYGLSSDNLPQEKYDNLKEDLEKIKSILKKSIPCFVNFYNFTSEKNNCIRFGGYYGNDKSFIGVCYLSLEELKGQK